MSVWERVDYIEDQINKVLDGAGDAERFALVDAMCSVLVKHNNVIQNNIMKINKKAIIKYT